MAGALIVVALVTPAFAQELSTGGSDTNGSDSDTSGGSITVGGGDTNGADAGLPTGGGDTNGSDQNTGNGDNGLTVGGGDTNGSDVNPNPSPSTPPGNGGGNPGGSPSGSGSSNLGGSRSGIIVTTVATSTGVTTIFPNSCPLITVKMLRLGGNNSSAEVAKLQAFLKNSQGFNVNVTGNFDAMTEAAVKAFQTKYTSEILLPWGGTKNSGIAYITTIKKINQLVCNQPLSLSASELAVINAFKANRAAGNVTPPAPLIDGTEIDLSGIIGLSTTTNTVVKATTTENTATVANTSIAARFWNFIVNLFR